jgi:hypothetical protein
LLTRNEKLERGMKVKVVPEHNTKQKFSETMEVLINKQKERANKLFQYKKSTCFESHIRKRRKVDITRGFPVSSQNIKFFEKNLNMNITKREANLIKLDSSKQYK